MEENVYFTNNTTKLTYFRIDNRWFINQLNARDYDYVELAGIFWPNYYGTKVLPLSDELLQKFVLSRLSGRVKVFGDS